jgi:hypothetical protein
MTMKTIIHTILSAVLLCGSHVWSQSTYTNFIRQVQFPSGVVWDASVPNVGEQLSALEINPGGARFELWTVNSTGPTSFLLDSSYVGAYVPVATLLIRSEDLTGVVTRTRADRPFFVDLTVNGLRFDEDAPDAARSVRFLHHVQSYGVGGTGANLDPTQAILQEQRMIEANGSQTLTFALTTVPGADRSKVRGEQRFSIFSLADYQAPASQIAAQTIQVWPVADGTLTGIAQNQLIRYKLPQLTLTMNDLYPNSTTYAQVYKGEPRLGVTGTVVPGSGLTINDSVPHSRVLVVKDYEAIFDEDGRWTMEMVTVTPFGIDRLAFVSFTLDRTMKVNGTVTTIE